ncbi:HEAT repeat-containing protein 3-like [Saccostrea echinata]|uniref:HEAT repeat-containing protein 3-like n=1 Tax=Saccostrea echinata TaxID=191078 RepID=UPI002A804661|nr:HEAT repeat-containing protein 3-like [Saccostrea echinata]
MGKTKNKKFKIARPKPTGLMSVKDAENEMDQSTESPNSDSIHSLLEKLNGPSEEERECSCTTLANLVSQPSAVKILLQHNVVKILAPVILDKNPEIQVKALGALRNLSVDGGETVCQEMVKKDVLTPLLILFKQYDSNWTPEKSTGKKHKDFKSSIFTEAVHILWNLCENSEEALEVFNKENLLPVLCPCMQYTVYGEELAVTVANCLYTVTEDNSPVIKMFQDPDVLGLLNSLISLSTDSSDLILLKTLATGIMVNVSSGKAANVSGSMNLTSLLRSVSDVLTLEAMDTAQKVAGASNSLLNGEIGMVTEEENGTPHKIVTGQEEVNEKFRDVQNILSAQQVALEIVANLCCINDDGWEDMENSESSSCDDDVDVSEEAMEQDTIDMFSSLCVSTEVQQGVKEFCLFDKVCLKCSAVDCGSLPKSITKSFVRLQAHALLCMNNMVNSMDLDLLGGAERLHQVWTSLATLMTNVKSTQGDNLLLEATTSALRAVIQKLANSGSPKLLEVSVSDLQFLFDLGRSCQSADIKVNIIRVISTVGVVFSKQTGLQNVDIMKLQPKLDIRKQCRWLCSVGRVPVNYQYRRKQLPESCFDKSKFEVNLKWLLIERDRYQGQQEQIEPKK